MPRRHDPGAGGAHDGAAGPMNGSRTTIARLVGNSVKTAPLDAEHSTLDGSNEDLIMRTRGYLPAFAILLALSVAARSQDIGSDKLAGAPSSALEQQIERCLALDVERLTLDSDYSAFMSPTCPTDVQVQALRRLWRQLPPPKEPLPTLY
jgi:hypothetical protein